MIARSTSYCAPALTGTGPAFAIHSSGHDVTTSHVSLMHTFLRRFFYCRSETPKLLIMMQQAHEQKLARSSRRLRRAEDNAKRSGKRHVPAENAFARNSRMAADNWISLLRPTVWAEVRFSGREVKSDRHMQAESNYLGSRSLPCLIYFTT